jgi:hypothetical protein
VPALPGDAGRVSESPARRQGPPSPRPGHLPSWSPRRRCRGRGASVSRCPDRPGPRSSPAPGPQFFRHPRWPRRACQAAFRMGRLAELDRGPHVRVAPSLAVPRALQVDTGRGGSLGNGHGPARPGPSGPSAAGRPEPGPARPGRVTSLRHTMIPTWTAVVEFNCKSHCVKFVLCCSGLRGPGARGHGHGADCGRT